MVALGGFTGQPADHSIAVLLKSEESVGSPRVGDVDEVIGNGGVDRGVLPEILSGPQIETTIDLAGVGGEDLGTEGARDLEENLIDVVIAADLQTPEEEFVTPKESLLVAMRKMNLRDVDLLPVLEGGESRVLIGLLTRADIMEAYQTRLLLEES